MVVVGDDTYRYIVRKKNVNSFHIEIEAVVEL